MKQMKRLALKSFLGTMMLMFAVPSIAIEKTVILAGGCFWCVESDLEKVKGIREVISGYSDGTIKNPTYKTYNHPKAGERTHAEVVKVFYESTVISYENLLNKLFRSIDPTDNKGQFGDRGAEYRPVIFYTNAKEKAIAKKVIAAHQKYYDKPINLEITKASRFYAAEKYHQNYAKKNPLRYKYYRYGSGRDTYLKKIWQGVPKVSVRDNGIKESVVNDKYSKPSKVEIKQKLTDLQFKVTQEEGTERAFANDYWENKAEGIYVDIVTGEPLFSSVDKYKSGTGWPSFTQPIDNMKLTEKVDKGLFSTRTEVRSPVGDSHLGHVFTDGPQDKGGLRYCVNSASLKFVAKASLNDQGYGQFLKLFELE